MPSVILVLDRLTVPSTLAPAAGLFMVLLVVVVVLLLVELLLLLVAFVFGLVLDEPPDIADEELLSSLR